MAYSPLAWLFSSSALRSILTLSLGSISWVHCVEARSSDCFDCCSSISKKASCCFSQGTRVTSSA